MILLPYPNFAHSVACLDDRLLEKQRIHGTRLMACLNGGGWGLPSAWMDHPSARMWRGYRSALGVYMTICSMEWERRSGARANMTPYNPATWLRHGGYPGELVEDARRAASPPWLGDRRLHESHQRTLLYANPEHYRGLGWRVVPKLDYWWPKSSAA